MIKFIEPNTQEWIDARIGCFSSSECVRLFAGGTRKMTENELRYREKGNRNTTVPTLFGKGAISYINEKVAEIINRRPKSTPMTKPMERGTMLENDALDLFFDVTGIRFSPSGLFKLNAFTCGTPDGHYGKRKVKIIAEVKCLNQDRFSEVVEFDAVEQIRDFEESYYAQVQMNMFLTGAKLAYLIFFDNRAMGYLDDGEIAEHLFEPEKFIYCLKYFKIKRDEVFIKELQMRIDAAADILVKKVEKRIKAAQKIQATYNRTQKR